MEESRRTERGRGWGNVRRGCYLPAASVMVHGCLVRHYDLYVQYKHVANQQQSPGRPTKIASAQAWLRDLVRSC